ncbi:peptidase S10 [Aureimonas leprariae]|uniref:Peptidase S10 n=2 Tax=Plantimonas leprariae TaxID=2615207 RepID=A0A7V7PRX0_9HYPH|nr:peptidase S10 [Aureimonas leprariae]
MLAAPVCGARAQSPGPDAGGGERPGALRLLPDAPSVTRRSVDAGGRTIRYAAEAGTLPLRAASGETRAAMFYVSYAQEPRNPARPVTFAFNGGPGAASAFLNLGALGPRAVGFAPDGSVPPPPARLRDNPDTWLAFTDLVFVDPVGTGYSRAADPEKASDYWGVDRDAEAMEAFIRLWLARNGRTGSPVFLAGESYGGFRAAVVARKLQADGAVAPSGMVMISPAIEFALLRGTDDFQPLPWALGLPGMAAVELERQGVRGEALEQRLAAAERFALGDYLLDLADGIAMKPETIDALARWTGLSPDLVRQRNGRVPASVFVKELSKRAGRSPSFYDGTVDGPDPEPGSARPEAPDAVLDRATPAFSSAFVAYVREEIGYRTDVTYRLLEGEIGGRWDYGTTPQRQGYAGALEDLTEARALNPSMQVMIAHGRTDLVTPPFATKYLIGQEPPLAGAAPVELRTYEGGHMMYMRADSRHALSLDARALFERAAAPAPSGGGTPAPGGG